MTLDRWLRARPTDQPRPVPVLAPTSGLPEHRDRPRRIASLALIWPYDRAGGIVAGVLPLEDSSVHDVEVGGFRVVAAHGGHPPYTHVVAAGRQDYLAAFAARPAAAPTGGPGGQAAPGVPRPPAPAPGALATADAADAGEVVAAGPGVGAERRAEERWAAEGGTLAGDRDPHSAASGARARRGERDPAPPRPARGTRAP